MQKETHRHGFICAGCWTVDRVKITDLWPEQEALARIRSVERQGGGSAHNVGIDLKKLDPSVPVSTVGVIGADEDGDYLRNQALTHDINTEFLHRSTAGATSYTDVITVANTGKRTFFHYPGTNDLLSADHFDFTHSSARILHLGLLSVHESMDKAHPDQSNGWSQVLKRAQENGIETSIEMVSIQPQRNRELAYPCLPWLDYLVVNDLEIGALGRMQTVISGLTDVEACVEAAKRVVDMGSMRYVIVHYPMGALCVSRNHDCHRSMSYDVPQSLIAGTVGAGDAFASGFLYAMHENWSLDDALELGHAVAAASLRSPNTVDSVETIEACRRFAAGLAKRKTPASS